MASVLVSATLMDSAMFKPCGPGDAPDVKAHDSRPHPWEGWERLTTSREPTLSAAASARRVQRGWVSNCSQRVRRPVCGEQPIELNLHVRRSAELQFHLPALPTNLNRLRLDQAEHFVEFRAQGLRPRQCCLTSSVQVSSIAPQRGLLNNDCAVSAPPTGGTGRARSIGKSHCSEFHNSLFDNSGTIHDHKCPGKVQTEESVSRAVFSAVRRAVLNRFPTGPLKSYLADAVD